MGEGEGSDIPRKNEPVGSTSTSNLNKLAREINLNAFGGTQVTAHLSEQSHCILFLQNALNLLDIIFRFGIIFNYE